MPVKKKKDAVETAHGENTAVAAPVNFEEDAGGGFENADKESYAIPYIVILQAQSPQCLKKDGAFVPGAEAGMFFNTATGELYDGAEGLLVAPAYYQRRFVKWGDREAGGGYKGDFAPEDLNLGAMERDDRGRYLCTDGAYLADTRYHFCILVREGGLPQPVVFSMASSQIKKSKGWMTRMSNLKIEGQRGLYTPPTFSHLYRIVTVAESNAKGDWDGVRVTLERCLGTEPNDGLIYASAKEFREQIVAGVAKVEEPSTGDAGDDAPF